MVFSTNLTILCVIFTVLVVAEKDQNIVRVRLESCPGCKLNRLADVKTFVYEDFPQYDNAEFKKIQGASPELLFLNDADEVVEKHALEHLSREECNSLLKAKGFYPRDKKEL